MNLPDHKRKIILDAAAWCAFSSTRSGCPIKSREHIYPILDQICFEDVLDEEKGAISKDQFNTWHKAECLKVSSALERTKKLEKDSMIGWAAKIINAYLKIACYLGGLGREGLVRSIHPPLDGGLARGIKGHLELKIPTIKSIKSYELYREIIQEIEKHTDTNGWLLIEIEKNWDPRK
jgi:hypothetical protein